MTTKKTTASKRTARRPTTKKTDKKHTCSCGNADCCGGTASKQVKNTIVRFMLGTHWAEAAQADGFDVSTNEENFKKMVAVVDRLVAAYTAKDKKSQVAKLAEFINEAFRLRMYLCYDGGKKARQAPAQDDSDSAEQLLTWLGILKQRLSN